MLSKSFILVNTSVHQSIQSITSFGIVVNRSTGTYLAASRIYMSASLLAHRVAVIYGAGRSIGVAVARAFAREGARIFLKRSNHEKS
jgi:hypothetical protein